jgi:hypothetical protein
MGGTIVKGRKKHSIHRTTCVNENEFKGNLQIILTKLTMLRNNIRLAQPDQKKTIILYLKQGRIRSAKIMLKQYLKEDDIVQVYEYLIEAIELTIEWSTYMLRLHHVFKEFMHILTLLTWASTRLEKDIPEFRYLREAFRLKYGDEFVNDSINNVKQVVNENIVNKIENWTIDDETLNTKLRDISLEENITVDLNNIDKDDEFLDEEAIVGSFKGGFTSDGKEFYLTDIHPYHHA